MIQDDLISVIIPVYNAEKYLSRCISSLINQTYANIEIILVNDASVDNSKEIIKKYAQKDSRIVLYDKQNEGAGLARNYGISKARGSLLAFCDADDYVESDMYEKMLSAMKNGNYDMACCLNTNETTDVNITGQCESFVEDDIWKLIIGQIGTKPSNKSDIVYGSGVWQGLFRKDIIENNDLKFKSERKIASEDLLFNLEYLSHCSSVIYVLDELYHHCDNDESMSHGRQYFVLENEFRLYRELECFLASNGKQKNKLELQRFLIKRVRNAIISISKSSNISNMYFDVREIGQLLSDNQFKKEIITYPGKLLPIKQRIMFFCMKHELSLVCYAICLVS